MMIATEDLMHMLEEMGISTGVDLYKLIEVVWLAEEIVGHPLYGFVSKAGPRPRYNRLYPMDMPRIETLEQARHFILGPHAYAGAPSPWSAPITSYQRPDSLSGQKAPAGDAPAAGRRAPGESQSDPALSGRQKKLLDLFGTGGMRRNYDYKRTRSDA